MKLEVTELAHPFQNLPGQELSLKTLNEDSDGRWNVSEMLRAGALPSHDTNSDGQISTSDDVDGNGQIDLEDSLTISEKIKHSMPYNGRLKIAANLAQSESRLKAATIQRAAGAQIKVHAVKPGLNIYEIEYPIENLPPQLDGFVIMQLSDTHFKGNDCRELDNIQSAVSKAVELGLKPQVVIHTGDIINKNAEEFSPKVAEYLQSLFPEAARFFVLGNHDYDSGDPRQIAQKMEAAGFTELTNRNARILVNGAALNITGLDDALLGTPKSFHVPFARRGETRIIATHSLDAVTGLVPQCVDLILSGHLHSGEFKIPLLEIDFVDLFMHPQGLYKDLNSQVRGLKFLSPRTASYISPGLSTHSPWGHRFRVQQPGIDIIRLKSWT